MGPKNYLSLAFAILPLLAGSACAPAFKPVPASTTQAILPAVTEMSSTSAPTLASIPSHTPFPALSSSPTITPGLILEASPTPGFPGEIYPSPVPKKGNEAWPGLSVCPNPIDLETGVALEQQAALDILNALETGDAVTRRTVTDPAMWELVQDWPGSGQPVPPEWISQPGPALDSAYGPGLAAQCGQELLEASWWVRNCLAPCDQASSASLIADLYFLKRNGVWLFWYIYP
jgi:hypothetical protein